VLNQALRHEHAWGWGHTSTPPNIDTNLKSVVTFTSCLPHLQGKSPRYPLDRLGGPWIRPGHDGREKNSLPLPENNYFSYLVKSTVKISLVMQCSPLSRHLLPLRPKRPPYHPVLIHPQFILCLGCVLQVPSIPYSFILSHYDSPRYAVLSILLLLPLSFFS
jgi:hypothetical protein